MSSIDSHVINPPLLPIFPWNPTLLNHPGTSPLCNSAELLLEFDNFRKWTLGNPQSNKIPSLPPLAKVAIHGQSWRTPIRLQPRCHIKTPFYPNPVDPEKISLRTLPSTLNETFVLHLFRQGLLMYFCGISAWITLIRNFFNIFLRRTPRNLPKPMT